MWARRQAEAEATVKAERALAQAEYEQWVETDEHRRFGIVPGVFDE